LIDNITPDTHGINTNDPEFFRRGLYAGFIHIQQPDLGAFLGKSAANSSADTAGRTGDNNHSVFKTFTTH
jgi:hypothetical protein